MRDPIEYTSRWVKERIIKGIKTLEDTPEEDKPYTPLISYYNSAISDLDLDTIKSIVIQYNHSQTDYTIKAGIVFEDGNLIEDKFFLDIHRNEIFFHVDI